MVVGRLGDGLCRLRHRLVRRWVVVGCGDGIGIEWMVVWVVEGVMVTVAPAQGGGACRSRVASCSSRFGVVVSGLGECWVV